MSNLAYKKEPGLTDYLDQHMNKLVEAIKNQPWEDKKFYQEYLAQTYYYTFHSCKMLAMVAALANEDQDSFYKRSLQHLREEFGHDNLALADLKRLEDTVDNHPELGTTRALWEPQFYKIQRQTTSLLGYILTLEYMCVKVYREIHDRVAKAHGEKAANFIRVHAEDDPEHVEKCLEQIEQLTDAEKTIVFKNYEQTCSMYAIFLNECATLTM